MNFIEGHLAALLFKLAKSLNLFGCQLQLFLRARTSRRRGRLGRARATGPLRTAGATGSTRTGGTAGSRRSGRQTTSALSTTGRTATRTTARWCAATGTTLRPIRTTRSRGSGRTGRVLIGCLSSRPSRALTNWPGWAGVWCRRSGRWGNCRFWCGRAGHRWPRHRGTLTRRKIRHLPARNGRRDRCGHGRRCRLFNNRRLDNRCNNCNGRFDRFHNRSLDRLNDNRRRNRRFDNRSGLRHFCDNGCGLRRFRHNGCGSSRQGGWRWSRSRRRKIGNLSRPCGRQHHRRGRRRRCQNHRGRNQWRRCYNHWW